MTPADEVKALRKALKAASKRIPVLGERALTSNLEAFGFSLAECYRQGVEEAQGEIIRRITELARRLEDAK